MFSREKTAEFFRLQADVIRKYSTYPITHNSALWFQLDNDLMANDEDFVSFDDYPTAAEYRRFIFDCDRFRGLKPHTPFMCMETSPGYNGYILGYDNVHPSGFIKAEATAVLALGGMGMSYWHFHQHYSGCEMTHGSILTASGKPTINYNQVAEVSRRIAALEKYIDSTEPEHAGTAIHYSDTARSFMQTENYDGMEYVSLLFRFHKVLLDRNIRTDIIPEKNDPAGYETVLTPFMYYLSDELIEKMLEFCENGGTWIVGPMSGVRTANHTVITEDLMTTMLTKKIDVTLLHYFPTKSTDSKVNFQGKEDDIEFFALTSKTNTGKAVAVCKGQFCDNEALITETSYGKGKVVILGAMPKSDDMLSLIINHYCGSQEKKAGIQSDTGIVTAGRVCNGKKSVIGFDMAGKGGCFTAYGKKCEVKSYGFGIIEA